MGWHTCEWCKAQDGDDEFKIKSAHMFSSHSSQDVTLAFDNGHYYQIPHTGLLHYVTSHGYRPPEAFVMDVLLSEIMTQSILYTKGIIPHRIERVGYLIYPDMPKGYVPDKFVDRLANIIAVEHAKGNVSQTRSVE